jgi:hypothetical protein
MGVIMGILSIMPWILSCKGNLYTVQIYIWGIWLNTIELQQINFDSTSKMAKKSLAHVLHLSVLPRFSPDPIFISTRHQPAVGTGRRQHYNTCPDSCGVAEAAWGGVEQQRPGSGGWLVEAPFRQGVRVRQAKQQHQQPGSAVHARARSRPAVARHGRLASGRTVKTGCSWSRRTTATPRRPCCCGDNGWLRLGPG